LAWNADDVEKSHEAAKALRMNNTLLKKESAQLQVVSDFLSFYCDRMLCG